MKCKDIGIRSRVPSSDCGFPRKSFSRCGTSIGSAFKPTCKRTRVAGFASQKTPTSGNPVAQSLSLLISFGLVRDEDRTRVGVADGYWDPCSG